MNRLHLLLTTLLITMLPLTAEEWANDLESWELGTPPEDLFVIDGDFEVHDHEGGKVLRLPPDPLIECGLLFGNSSKASMTASVDVWAEKRGRRSFPRFGIGVHGISGFRLRVVPAQKRLELLYQEEVIEQVPFAWKSGTWIHLKLAIVKGSDKPTIKAWAWLADGEEPEEPNLMHTPAEDVPTQGKASLWGTPYSGKDILFDNLKVVWETDE